MIKIVKVFSFSAYFFPMKKTMMCQAATIVTIIYPEHKLAYIQRIFGWASRLISL